MASTESGKMANLAPRAPANSAGPRRRARPFWPGLVLLLDGLHADVGQQAGQQRLVHPVGQPGLVPGSPAGLSSRRRVPGRRTVPAAVDDHAEVAGGLAELPVHVLPLAHPQVVQVLAAAHPAERRRGQLALLVAQVVPERDEGQEVRARLGEPGVLGVGRLPRVGRAAPAGPGWTAPAAMISTSRTQPCWPASRIIRPSRGSSGSRASLRPTSVSCGRPRGAG